MITFYIGRNSKDLEFNSSNNFKMVEETEEILQRIRLLLETRAGEFFLDIDHGLNYEPIFVKIPDLDRIRAEVLIALSQEPEIATVDELEIDFEREIRNLKIRFTLTWTNGETTENTLEEVV